MTGLQVKELSAKLADAESKKAALETMLALKERQVSEVRVFNDYICYFFTPIGGLDQCNFFLQGKEWRSKEAGG